MDSWEDGSTHCTTHSVHTYIQAYMHTYMQRTRKRSEDEIEWVYILIYLLICIFIYLLILQMYFFFHSVSVIKLFSATNYNLALLKIIKKLSVGCADVKEFIALHVFFPLCSFASLILSEFSERHYSSFSTTPPVFLKGASRHRVPFD